MPVLDLIHRFLLESGFPKASIVRNVNMAQPEPMRATTLFKPAYSIVDPETCETLAAIDVIETSDNKQVTDRSLHVLRHLAGTDSHPVVDPLEGFLIQVNREEPNEDRQVIFYKLFHDKGMEEISTFAFPDLDTLKVSRKLGKQQVVEPVEYVAEARTESTSDASPTRLPLIVAILLVIFALVDLYLVWTRGHGLLTVQQTLLLISAALLLVIPSIRAKTSR